MILNVRVIPHDRRFMLLANKQVMTIVKRKVVDVLAFEIILLHFR